MDIVSYCHLNNTKKIEEDEKCLLNFISCSGNDLYILQMRFRLRNKLNNEFPIYFLSHRTK